MLKNNIIELAIILNVECAKIRLGNNNLPYISGSFFTNLICFIHKYIADGKKITILSKGTQKNNDSIKAIQA